MVVTVTARTMDNRINFQRTGCVWLDLVEIETPRFTAPGVHHPSLLPRIHTAWWRVR